MRHWFFLLLLLVGSGLQGQQQNSKEEIELLKQQIQALQKRVQMLEDKQQHQTKPTTPSHRPESQPTTETGQPRPNSALTEKAEEKTNYFEAFWQHGLRLQTQDRHFSLAFHGYIFVDSGFTHEDSAIKRQIGESEDYAKFRSVRLHLSGRLYQHFLFSVQFNFANSEVAFKDVYLGVDGLPFAGKILVGHFKEPFSLETLTSSRYLTFMERGAVKALVPSRNLGIAYYGHGLDDRLTVALGIFRETGETPPRIDDDSNSYAATTRVTVLPLYQKSESRLLHLGAAYSYRQPRDEQVRYRSRPESHGAEYYLDTKVIGEVADVHLAGGEIALALGSFSLQSEVVYSWVRPEDLSDGRKQYWGAYVFASILLTGEQRNYQTAKGVFDRIIPDANFLQGGPGAWELTVRYSHLDLEDNGAGRRMDSLTSGLNWYLNPHVRIMFNYVYCLVAPLTNSEQSDAHLFLTRFQVDF